MQHIDHKSLIRRQDGSIMVTALMIMSILSIVGIYANNIAGTELQITTNVETNTMAFYDADAGVQHTLALIKQQLNTGTTINNIDLTDSEYQAPTGFSFTVTTDNPWLNNSGPHRFVSTGKGPRNATHSIEVSFTNTLEVHPAFKVGILSDGDININGAPDMTGSIHANGDVVQNGAGIIRGNVSAGNSVSIGSTVEDGGIYANADLFDVPQVTTDHFNAWRTQAMIAPNSYVNGNHTVPDTGNLNGKIIFVDGDVTIPNSGSNSIINATIIATGNVTFRGQSTLESPGGPVGVVVISGGDILFNGSGDSWGAFWCNGSFKRNGSSNVNGAIVAGNAVADLDITFNGAFEFIHSDNINSNIVPKEMSVKLASWADQGLVN
jgi:Tfp pilus assembly protein PilX